MPNSDFRYRWSSLLRQRRRWDVCLVTGVYAFKTFWLWCYILTLKLVLLYSFCVMVEWVYRCFKRVAELGVLPCALFTGEEQKQGGRVSKNRENRSSPPHSPISAYLLKKGEQERSNKQINKESLEDLDKENTFTLIFLNFCFLAFFLMKVRRY